MRKAIRKPLSFSTTMRNPDRIIYFLQCIIPYENQILTDEIILKIICDILQKRLYKPMRLGNLKEKFSDINYTLTSDELKYIIEENPQDHKEAGFSKGWSSRFDTFYKLMMEFGFIYYEMNCKILISKLGNLLIETTNPVIIQNIFLNSLLKYSSNNPFRKNLNSTMPLLLLLNVINILRNDTTINFNGIYWKEIPLFICWRDNNALELSKLIKNIRTEYKFSYGDEFIYDKCLVLLDGINEEKRFKKSQIMVEATDEYIRKMRSTGIISLRGNGSFLDFNMLEIDKINYILNTYSFKEFNNYTKSKWFDYISIIDNNLIDGDLKKSPNKTDNILRKNTLNFYANSYTKEEIFNELKILGNKNKGSKNPIFKLMAEPLRFEFLTAISLKQNLNHIDISPNYIIDDEGLPISTATGGKGDIYCSNFKINALVEVSLLTNRLSQITNEMLPITRHLKDSKDDFALFIAPKIHEDVIKYCGWIKYNDKLVIIPQSIEQFINSLKKNTALDDFILN